MEKMNFFLCIILLCSAFNNVLGETETVMKRSRGATMKPLSICCEMPELGNPKPLEDCSNPILEGPCENIECVFEKSGFLVDKSTLNKEAYKTHLRQFAESNNDWSAALERVIQDCVDKDPPSPRNPGLWQDQSYPCKARDVFGCTTTAMLKACPKSHWKC